MKKDLYIKQIRKDQSTTTARFLLVPEGHIICCNPYACKMFKYDSFEQIEGCSYKELVPKEFSESLPDKISTDYLTHGEYLPRVNRCGDGSLIPTLILTQYVFLENQCYIETFVRLNDEDSHIGELRYKQLAEILKCELDILKAKDTVCDDAIINTQLQLALTDYGLTVKELQFCSLLHNGMHTKEIADTLCFTLSSIYSFRKRLRKKLNLDPHTDLFTFLQKLTKS